MDWIFCFIGSALLLALSIGFTISVVVRKKDFNVTELRYAILALVCSSIMLFIPVYWAMFEGTSIRFLKTVLLSIHNTIRLFVVDGDFEMIVASTATHGDFIRAAYQFVAAIIFCCAPIFTFSVAISFFKNFSSSFRFWCIKNNDVYVFSELNVESFVLAKDIKKNHKDARIVFTTSNEEEKSSSTSYWDELQKMDAIYFRKPITTLNFAKKSPKLRIKFILIDHKEEDVIGEALFLIQHYNDRENTEMYVFTNRTDHEMILTNTPKGKMIVRRINEDRALITRFLYDHGFCLFDEAEPMDDCNKKISAVIVGLGGHGTEMLKSLTWYCQMPGYDLNIQVFDKNAKAEEYFTSKCPELMSERLNGKDIPGECKYKIDIHSDMDVRSSSFDNAILNIKDATFVFVSLGSDDLNVETAVKLRMLMRRNKRNPTIYAVVVNSKKVNALRGATNYQGQEYNINYIGDIENEYSDNVIVNSVVENEALKRHLKYGVEDAFWRYEYNYRSSIAAALHLWAREHCGVSWANKKEDQLTKEEQELLIDIEHKRWCAYMRSEGYVYSGSPEKSSRDDLAKMHHNLCTQLNEEDRMKDVRVGSK